MRSEIHFANFNSMILTVVQFSQDLEFSFQCNSMTGLLGVHQTMALIVDDAKQAISEEKSGPIKTLLMATALYT